MNKKEKLHFKRLKVSGPGSKALGDAQKAYEGFWSVIENAPCAEAEKELALRALQESCMWMTRGIAVENSG